MVSDISNCTEICRACLSKNTSTLRPLFGSNLSELFQTLTSIKISPIDGLPSLICVCCANRLTEFNDFKNVCHSSDIQLKQIKLQQPNGHILSSENDEALHSILENQNQTSPHHNSSIENNVQPCILLTQFSNNNNLNGLNETDNNSHQQSHKLEYERLELTLSEIKPEPLAEEYSNVCSNGSVSTSQHHKLSDRSQENLYKCQKCTQCFLHKSLLRTHIMLTHRSTITKKHKRKFILKINVKTPPSIIESHKCSGCSKKSDDQNSRKLQKTTKKTPNATRSIKKMQTKVQPIKRKISTQKPVKSSSQKIPKTTQKKPKKKSTKLKLFECKKCSKKFASKDALKSHKATHNTNKKVTLKSSTFLCKVCGKKFNGSSALIKHNLTHKKKSKSTVNVKTFDCKMCLKRFKNQDSHRIHKRTHRNQEIFPCPKCPKQYTSKQAILYHVKKHIQVKPIKRKVPLKPATKITKKPTKLYKCGICQKEFQQKNSLTAHNWIHTGGKPFKCNVCQLDFVHETNYRRHKQRKHPTNKGNGKQ